MSNVTVVGGGIAGLTAAITAAQQGARVRVLEERAELGGRARTTDPPYLANLGPHALYSDGPLWHWLNDEDLLPETVPRGNARLVYRQQGATTTTPHGLSDAIEVVLSRERPPALPFGAWARTIHTEQGAELLSALASIPLLDANAERLSAAFVHERLRRVVQPGVAHYVVGGWQSLVLRLRDRALSLGVTIETGHKVVERPAVPVVVATSAAAAARLLRRPHLRTEGTRIALLDLALSDGDGIPASLLDVDNRLYLAEYTAWDRSLAPKGTELIQISCGCRAGESFAAVQARIESVLDDLVAEWRSRTCWLRRNLLSNATGAVDFPGKTWEDRPAIDQGAGVFCAGDYLAAPGLLSEVSFTSGAFAGAAAAEFAATRRRTRARQL